MNINLALLVIAFILTFLAALGLPRDARFSLGWLGVAFWLLDIIFAGH